MRGDGHIRPLALTVALLAVLAVGACGDDKEETGGQTAASGGTVGLSEFFLKDLGQREIKETFEEAADAEGFKTVTTDANNQPEQQLADVQNLLTQDVEAIAINPVDSAAIVPAVEAANSKNVPVFTVDRAPAGGKVALTVRTDNVTLGEVAGERMVELLEERNGAPKGTVLQVTGDLATTNARDRGKGFEDVIKQHPDIELITKEAKGWDPKNGADTVRTIVGAGDPEIDAVYFHSEFTGAGIIPALDRLGQKPVGEAGHIIVVGIDGSPDGLKWIREGKLDATVSQPLSDFGKVTFKYGIRPILNGETLQDGPVEEEGAIWSPARLDTSTSPGPTVLLKPSLVTKDNVDDERLWGNAE